MNRRDALSLCRRWLPLWTGNQPERLLEVYSEDVFYRDPAKPDGIRGKASLLAYLHKLLRPTIRPKDDECGSSYTAHEPPPMPRSDAEGQEEDGNVQSH